MQTPLEQVQKIIGDGNAFVKTMCSPIGDDNAWKKLLGEITDPEHQRGLTHLDKKIDRNQVYNPKIDRWEQRNYTNKPRGAFKKGAIYTKKTSVSLFSKDGIMRLFQSANPKYPANIALILDSSKCDLKNEKYVFNRDIEAHTRWWQKRKNPFTKKHRVIPSMPMIELKKEIESQRNQGLVPIYNEMLVGLSKEAVIGILIVKDTLEERLNAIAKKELVKNALGCDVPLFIQNFQTGLSEYTLQQQYDDIQAARKQEKTKSSFILVTQYISEEYKRFLSGSISASSSSLADTAKNIESLPPEMSLEILQKLSPDEIQTVNKEFSEKARKDLSSGITKILIDQMQQLLQVIDNKYQVQINEGSMTCYENIINDNINLIFSFIVGNANNKLNEQRYKIVSLLIEHLSYAKNSNVAIALEYMLENKYSQDVMPIINLLIEKHPNLSVKREFKVIGYEFQSGWMYEDEVENEIRVNCWSTLVAGMLNHNAEKMAKLIVNHFPQHFAQTIKSLEHIEKQTRERCDINKCYYQPEDIENCRLALLLQMNEHCHYQVSKNDKQILRSHFQKTIANTKSKDELNSVVEEFKHCESVRQRRHPIADNIYQFFLRKPKLIASVEIVSKSVNEKTIALN